jgi:hypothetical protein
MEPMFLPTVVFRTQVMDYVEQKRREWRATRGV